ncbi:hypothetical protein BDP27DRAFT_1255060 [Rhodocollybia butyracea]|uniref:SRR1-like domain-containing protein n=1 Tax=Rhodocollybia butyracea TaxID=206335 RepID=A0A9P5Q2A9_9AGAR|nr:hypothetical protein BDP27DRAFT_1255060 [Rhodocollybia butyracea]
MLGFGKPSIIRKCSCSVGISSQNEYFKISIYDPVFTDEDRSLFEQLGIRLLEGDGLGVVAIEGPTILFMPHCHWDLYEDILRANWSLNCMENAVFICNHFDNYVQNNPIRLFKEKAPHILKIATIITSVPLPASPDWPFAFNSISTQYISEKETLSESWFGKAEGGTS